MCVTVCVSRCVLRRVSLCEALCGVYCADSLSPPISLSLSPPPSAPQWRQCAFHLVKKPSFEYGILAAIVINVLFMAMEFQGQPLWWDDTLRVLNYIFSALFFIEAVLKVRQRKKERERGREREKERERRGQDVHVCVCVCVCLCVCACVCSHCMFSMFSMCSAVNHPLRTTNSSISPPPSFSP